MAEENSTQPQTIKFAQNSSPTPTTTNRPLKFTQRRAQAEAEHPESKSKSWILWVVLCIVALAGAIAAGYYLLKLTSKNTDIPEPTPTPIPEPTSAPVPTATPTPSYEKSEFTITILNGSGVSGLASKTQSTLEDASFTVEKVGNANNNSYEKTLITYQEDVPEGLINELEETLSSEFELDDPTPDPDSTTHITIILGQPTNQ